MLFFLYGNPETLLVQISSQKKKHWKKVRLL